jgi:O-succinylhomoserine sulfhydrylase
MTTPFISADTQHEHPTWHAATAAIRTAAPRSQYGENSEALYLSSSFVHPDAATAARRFAGEEEAFIYSRFSNPTVASMEMRLAAMEGAEAAIATASGMGALSLLCLSVLQAGDHIVCSRSVFGSIIKLLGSEMARFGVETTFVSQTDVAEWKAAIRPGKTKMLLAETPTNPLTEVCDIAALADVAHNAGAILVVDNCFCTPALQKPLALGADVIMQSATKYLDGQGRVIAGALCASDELINKKILPVQRSMGITLSPFNAWVVLKGMETLNLRMKAHSEQALELAQWLESHPAVDRVYYPGLASHPQHDLAMRQQNAMGKGLGGAVLSFAVKGKTPEELRANAFAVVDGTRILSITANLGDVKTIITHPASTTHGRLSEDQRLAAGIHQGVLRVAVGLEAMSDIQRDLATGLNGLS